jgi:hypothetical protein
VAAGFLSGRYGVQDYFVVTSLVCFVPGLFIIASKKVSEIDRPRASVDRQLRSEAERQPDEA